MTIKRKITITALFIAIGGILAEFLLNYNIQNKHIEGLGYINGIIQLHNFSTTSFYFVGLFSNISILNLAFYSLLLLGTFIYLLSNTKETRLIRFSFSVLLLSQILHIFFGIYSFFFWEGYEYTTVLSKTFTSVLISLLFIIYSLFWIYVLYWILKKLERETETFEENHGDNVIDYMVEASKYQRFLHFILDTIIVVLLFSGYLYYFKKSLFNEYFSHEVSLWILLIVCRFIYYMFFEKILGTTPAKLLTETKVLSDDGQKIGFKQVFTRTVYRFVPFEPISFFMYGWHDTWSKTTVVKEKQLGVNGNKYLWFFPAFILIGLGSYFGADWYNEYQQSKKAQLIYENKIIEFRFQLENLTNNHLIVLKDMKEYKPHAFLKVEEVKNDVVVCTVIDLNSAFFSDNATISFDGYSSKLSYEIKHQKSEYEENLTLISELYNDNKNNGFFKQITISKSLLNKCYTKEYEKSTDFDSNQNGYGAELLRNGKVFEINNVVKMFSPILSLNGSSSQSQYSFSFEIENKGWETEMVEIKNLEGKVSWTNQLPEKIPSNSSFYLNGSDETKNPFKIQIKLKDLNNNTYTYIVEGVHPEFTIKKINP